MRRHRGIKWQWQGMAALFFTVLLVLVDVISYQRYRDHLVAIEQGQLLTLARTIGTSLWEYLDEELDKLDLCLEVFSSGERRDAERLREVSSHFLDKSQGLYRGCLCVREGEELFSSGQRTGEWQEAIGKAGPPASILGKYLAETGWFEMLVGREVSTDQGKASLVFSMDLNLVYEKIVSPVRIGEAGYSVVKDSDLAIIMHHAQNQIGMDALYDREERYPQLNLESLKSWLELQRRQEEGVGILDSYVWDQADLPPVQRLVAYTTIDIHGERWIVNSTLPISELAAPLRRMMTVMAVLTLLYLGIVTVLGATITWEKTRYAAQKKELEYLKEINRGMELIARKNEEIRHYQRVQSLGLMSSHIAHEFNNYLTPVMVYGEMLESDEKIGEENKQLLQEMLASVEQAAGLSRELLNFSRMDAGGKYSALNLTQDVKEALSVVRQLVPRRISFSAEISSKDAWLMGREGMMQHILMNLCKNAFQALEEAPQKKLTLTYEVEGRKALLTVEDTGCGIGEENLRNIFEPYYTTKGSSKGTGLGLSVVRNVVENCGGIIEVKSQEGKGTVFRMTFPVEESAQDLQQSKREGRGDKMICVLGPSSSLSPWEKYLESLGNITYTSQEASVVARLQEENAPWNGILLMEQLGEMSGIELAQIVRRFDPSLRIILLAMRETQDLKWYLDNRVIDGIQIPDP